MLGYIIYRIANLYSFIIVIYCIFTWFPVPSNGVVSDIFRFLRAICDPFLNLFRKLLPPIGGTVDVTPIIALLVLQLGAGIIARLL